MRSLDSLVSDGLWTRGFRNVDANAVFQGTTFRQGDANHSFLPAVLLINLPQLLLSAFYYLYNAIITSMHAAEEWSGFATERKTLRVSQPEKGQRSTYWLNLPWSYSAPLLILSALMHWLVSRSLYLVRISIIGPRGEPQPDKLITACGFSTLAMLMVIVLWGVMVVFLLVVSHRKLSQSIPLIGTTSAAVSAMCHHPNDRATEAFRPLLWGVTEEPIERRPGHCSLSSGKVSTPVAGCHYS